MARSSKRLSVRMSETTGRRRKKRARRKKPANRVERAFDEMKQLVGDACDRLLSAQRSGRRRQVATKQAGAKRIRGGKQRQAAAKQAARRRGAKTS